MSPSTIGLLSLILLMSCFLQVYSVPAAYICKGRKRGENCFVMINLLRSPLQSPNWSVSSWNRAMNQQKAYQQLFQEPEVVRRRRSRSLRYGRGQPLLL
ncbi:unnamed protein product [Cylicocyclus nassatus]|uniref:Uncharacterized protein n=1 Tax=Cylicocyclus nassatus TaxID=53992 RepID=A0AA36M729_CYLNA|nr:unnamed protein product [Cylicocyclus nassatus]